MKQHKIVKNVYLSHSLSQVRKNPAQPISILLKKIKQMKIALWQYKNFSFHYAK